MSKRLVITARKDRKNIAAILYSWSGYSRTALLEAKDLLEFLKEEKEERGNLDARLACLRFGLINAASVWGGDGTDDVAYVSKLYPKAYISPEVKGGGLCIALSESGIRYLQSLAEYDLLIDLDENWIVDNVYTFFESFEEYWDWIKASYSPKDYQFFPQGENDPKVHYFAVDVSSFGIDKINEVIGIASECFFPFHLIALDGGFAMIVS